MPRRREGEAAGPAVQIGSPRPYLVMSLEFRAKGLHFLLNSYCLPEKSKWIKDQIWHKDQKVKYFKDGSFELSFPVADFSEIKREILKHGDAVEVIKPKTFRDLIKAEAEKIAKIY